LAFLEGERNKENFTYGATYHLAERRIGTDKKALRQGLKMAQWVQEIH